MVKLLVLSAVLAGSLAASALAQPVPGVPIDDTNNVRSARIGMPGNTTDPMTQYQTQRAMDNLPGQDAEAKADLGSPRPAKLAELAAGALVNDKTGILIAKIDKVDSDGVVVSTGAAKVKIPADAFGHNKAGLLLDMTKAQFDQIVAKANGAS